jgi:very-short-patch-repair endonuclease
MIILKNHPDLRSRRKELRKNMSQPEQWLWYCLRNGQLKGYKFRRQYGFLNYILDFYCIVARLAIEVDGDSHYTAGAHAYDALRTKDLSKAGVKVLRFTNQDINTNIEGVVTIIASHLP